MKRRAWSLPLAAIVLAAGTLAILRRESAAVAPLAKGSPARPAAGAAPVSAPAPPAEAPRGSLRILVRSGAKVVAGAAVTLLHEESHRQMEFATRPDGTETILALPAGDYHVAVRHPGFVFASVHRRVEGRGPEELTLELQQGARLEGRVSDGSGRPLAGTRVLLLEPRVGAPIANDLGARTDATGAYRIEGIPDGLYDVQFRHERHRSWMHPSLAVTGPGQVFHVNVVMAEGRRMAGRVVDEAGEPVSGATVVSSNEESVTSRSGDGGRFALEGLGEAPVYCFASAPGYGIAFLRGVPVGSQDVELRLPRTVEVSGQIDAPSLPARFNVQLSWYDPDAATYFPLYTRAFDGAGGPEFSVPEVSPGRYRLEVHADGYEAQDVPEVSVPSGRPLAGVQIRLRKKP